VPEEDVRDVDLDIVERYQMPYVEEGMLFHVSLNHRLRSEDIIDDDRDQSVKDWKTGNIERLDHDPLFVKPCPIGIYILLCNYMPTLKQVRFIILVGDVQISG
jgi:hypothetical protein